MDALTLQPETKTLCLKARERGIPCTTEHCNHSDGGYVMLMHSDGTSESYDLQGPCKACGAVPDVTAEMLRQHAETRPACFTHAPNVPPPQTWPGPGTPRHRDM